MSDTILDVKNLCAISRRTGQPILRDVSFSVECGRIVGLVGESGAGKSTIAKVVLGILSSGVKITSGAVLLGGQDLLTMPEGKRRTLIGSQVALVPQDPLTALNPGRRIGPQLIDGLRRWKGLDRKAAWAKGQELLDTVAIRDPERVMSLYPHQLSGGMRQRVLIAAAFSIEPRLLIADEPTTALDVTVQKQVLLVLKRLQREQGTSVVFVTHDLGVVAQICDSVALLFSGKIMEKGPVADVFQTPAHAYTRALLAASPRPDDSGAGLRPIDDAVIAACREEIARFDGVHHD